MKLPRIFKKKNMSIPELYEKKKITAEYIINHLAKEFISGAYNFYYTCNGIRIDFGEMDEEIAKLKAYKTRDDLSEAEKENLTNLTLLTIEVIKIRFQGNVVGKNNIDLLGGMVQLESMRECNEICSSDLFTKDAFLAACRKEENISAARKEQIESSPTESNLFDEFLSNLDETLEHFYAACHEYHRLFTERTDGGTGKESDMFDDDGCIMIRNENGEYERVAWDPLNESD